MNKHTLLFLLFFIFSIFTSKAQLPPYYNTNVAAGANAFPFGNTST